MILSCKKTLSIGDMQSSSYKCINGSLPITMFKDLLENKIDVTFCMNKIPFLAPFWELKKLITLVLRPNLPHIFPTHFESLFCCSIISFLDIFYFFWFSEPQLCRITAHIGWALIVPQSLPILLQLTPEIQMPR